jgi:hypothetical protein
LFLLIMQMQIFGEKNLLSLQFGYSEVLAWSGRVF